MTIFRRSALAVAALSIGLGITGCSSDTHHGATHSATRATFGQTGGPSSSSASSTSNPTGPTSSSASSTSNPTSSSTDSSDSSTGDPLSSAALTGNAPPATGSSGIPGSDGNPRGGQGGAPNTGDGQAQITNFLKTVFSYDTNIDTSESGAAERASKYASGQLAGSLSSQTQSSSDFAAAKPHHGYTTVSVGDTQYGQPSASDNYLTVCKAVTVTWHGDPGWKPPAPETNSWCVDALPSGDRQWTVTSMSLVGSGS